MQIIHKEHIKWSLLMVLLVLTTSCHHTKKTATPEDVQKIIVSADIVRRGQITEFLTLNGVTLFQKKGNIRANSTGYVSSFFYKLGDQINAGNTFCTIQTKEQNALKEISKIDSSLAKFTKPLSLICNANGILASIAVMNGDYVAEGDILATVTEPTSMVVVINVPFEYHPYISTGKACEITLPDGKTFSALVSGVMPTVDIGSQSQEYYIRLPHLSLPENLNVIIRFPYRQALNVLCIPKAALQTDELQQEFWVMKVVHSMALKVPVSIGLQSDSIVEVKPGMLQSGDRIITEGSYELADSSEITIQ